MRVYLTGADGMLGSALLAELAARQADWPVRGVSIRDFDIADEAAVAGSIGEFAPDVVVHTAAHAIVEDCESDPGLALRVNVAGTHHVAAACRRAGSRLVYLSSDYVFDGRVPPAAGYREDDLPNPGNVYGLTKLAGERIAATVDDHLVVRTSWLFGGADERTDNVRALTGQLLAGTRPPLIHDQFSGPTYVADLAGVLVGLLAAERPVTGTLHVANTGRASWHEVGLLVARLLRERGRAREPRVRAVALADCGLLGQRPRESGLNTDRLAALGPRLPHWSDAVSRYCDRLLADQPARPDAEASHAHHA